MDTAPPTPPCCLVVDDDEAMRYLLCHHLERNGAVVVQAPTGKAALDLIATQDPPFSLVVTDNRMPGHASGADVLDAAARRAETTALLLMTAHVDPVLARTIEQWGAEVVDKADLPSVVDRWRAQAARRGR